jgi:hypothetical protein
MRMIVVEERARVQRVGPASNEDGPYTKQAEDRLTNKHSCGCTDAEQSDAGVRPNLSRTYVSCHSPQ